MEKLRELAHKLERITMTRIERKGWSKHLDFILLDVLSLVLAHFANTFIAIGNGFFTEISTHIFYFALLLVLDFIVLLLFNTMHDVLRRGYFKEFVATLIQSGVMFFVSATSLFFLDIEIARKTVALVSFLYFVISYVVRVLYKPVARKALAKSRFGAILLVVNTKNAAEIIERVERMELKNNKVQGLVINDTLLVGKSIAGVPVVCNFDGLLDYATGNWVDEILIATDYNELLDNNVLDELLDIGVTVHVDLNGFVSNEPSKSVVNNYGSMSVVSTSKHYITARQYAIKRCTDIVGALVGLLITGILYIFFAPIIKIMSPGPVFFAQTRIGKNGKPFKMYKFRSMHMDAEERKAMLMKDLGIVDPLMFKMDFDPRIIGNRIDSKGRKHYGFGAFIRRFSLDEFPQFYNILKGDMSLVGTRPPLVSEYSKYSIHHRMRLATVPGLTGLWQISGRSKIKDFEEVVRLDTEYINTWSIRQDIKILLKTIWVVVKGEGAS